MPLLPPLVLEVGSGPQVPSFHNFTYLDPQVGLIRNLGARQFCVTDVVMNLLQHLRALRICNIIFLINFVGYVDQNTDLHVIQVDILHFILSFECVV
jgi:hypothetical protein